MLQPGSPPEDCEKLADRCSVDVSGHYIEVANNFHVTITQHCCQLFIEQDYNKGFWSGMVLNSSLLVAGQTGYILGSSIRFSNMMEWMKVAAVPTTTTTTTKALTTVTTIVGIPCSQPVGIPCSTSALPMMAALPTIPVNTIYNTTMLPSTTKKPGMTQEEEWWAVGASVAGAVGIGAVVGTAVAVSHNIQAQKTTTTTLPPEPIISRKSAAKVITTPSVSAPSLRGRQHEILGVELNDGNTMWIVGFFLAALICMCVACWCAFMLRKRSKSGSAAARSYSNLSLRSISHESSDLLRSSEASFAASQAMFEVGESVEGHYMNWNWYDARVAAVNDDGTYLLDWADHGLADRIKHQSDVRKKATVLHPEVAYRYEEELTENGPVLKVYTDILPPHETSNLFHGL